MKTYKDANAGILKSIPHRGGAVELKTKAPELTFLGVDHQPDFGTLFITLYPNKKLIELKAFKQYLYQYRDLVISYERFVDVVYEHMMQVYEPARLRLVLVTHPRGGISSKLTIDSDWAIRGGKEQYRDWQGMDDTW